VAFMVRGSGEDRPSIGGGAGYHSHRSAA